MEAAYLPVEDSYFQTEETRPVLDLSAEVPLAWASSDFAVPPPLQDTYEQGLEGTFADASFHQAENEAAFAGFDDPFSPTPSSPSSDTAPVEEYSSPSDMLFGDDFNEDHSFDDTMEDEESDEKLESASLDESSAASPNMAESSSSIGAPVTRKRGRPKTKAAPTAAPAATPTSGSRKRKADSMAPESLLGTKKAKTGSATTSLIDRMPSSISAVELQAMSSADYDVYYQAVASKLSRTELEVAKAQRRRIKNRESASNSRVRKQDNLADLEQQVNALRQENSALKQKSLAIEAQHDALSRELENYKKIVRESIRDPSLIPNFFASNSSATSFNASAASRNNARDAQALVPTTGTRSSRAAAVVAAATAVAAQAAARAQQQAAGPTSTEHVTITTRAGRSTRPFGRDLPSTALMCLVLFAMIWGYSWIPGSVFREANLPVGASSRISFPLPAGADPSTPAMAPVSSLNSHNHGNSAHKPQGDREWLVKAINRARLSSLASHAQAQAQAAQAAPSSSVETGSIQKAPTVQASTQSMLVSTQEIPHMNETILPATLAAEPLATSSSSASTASSMETTSYSPQWKQNTTYVKCENMQQVVPPTGAQAPVDPNQPLYISLWVNPSTLGGSDLPSASKDPFNMDYLVQITCQIMTVDQLGVPTAVPLPSNPSMNLPAALSESSV